MTLNDALHWRYSTKSFDPTKKISAADFAQLQEVLQFSPSSINLQPWHFVIADDDAGKARIAKGAEAENYRYNAAKITNASHVIVVCAKVIADEAHLQAVLDQEEADGRFATPENKVQRNGVCNLFLNFHRYDLKDEPHWHARQAMMPQHNAKKLFHSGVPLMIGAFRQSPEPFAKPGLNKCPAQGVVARLVGVVLFFAVLLA